MRGIDYLCGDPPSVVLFLDGDYSDHPDEAGLLLEPILSGEADFVVGSRLTGHAEPGSLLPQAKLGNRFACGVMRLLYGFRFTDLGPFRAIRFNELLGLDLQEMTYGWTVEMQIKAVKAGLRCREVPVSYRKRVGKSKVTGTVKGTVKASVRILRVLARHAFTRRR
jgi:hypothetical protein